MKFFLAIIMFSLFSCSSLISSEEHPLQRMAFGSCNDQDLPQTHWKVIAKSSPQVWIAGGDNIYADTSQRSYMQEKYNKLKSNPEYKKFRRTVSHIIGTWDDHDFGENNGGANFSGKHMAKELFLDFFDAPYDDSRRRHEGIYTSYSYGPQDQQIKVILLDVRTFKTDNNLIGEEQWSFLEKELRHNKAQLTLIVSGIQIIPMDHRYEKWNEYPHERKRLLELIKETQTKKALFLSGDRHFSEFSRLRWEGGEILEVTSSGMTHSYSDLTYEKNSYREGDFFSGKSFSTFSLHWDSPRHVLVEIKDMRGETQQSAKLHF